MGCTEWVRRLAARRSGGIEYGTESPTTVEWDDAATARMKKVPAFVAGMVMRAVEESAARAASAA